MYSFKALMDVETFCTAIFKKKQLLKETVLKTTHPYYKVYIKCFYQDFYI